LSLLVTLSQSLSLDVIVNVINHIIDYRWFR